MSLDQDQWFAILSRQHSWYATGSRFRGNDKDGGRNGKLSKKDEFRDSKSNSECRGGRFKCAMKHVLEDKGQVTSDK
jgi:hypothetical protein